MTYDLLILGGGPAGFRAAERAGHFGLNAAIFEGKTLGGVCLNEGCIPTKTMLYSAKLYDYAKGGAEKYGVTAKEAALDHAFVVARKDKIVKKLVAGVEMQMKKARADVVRENGGVPVAVGMLVDRSGGKVSFGDVPYHALLHLDVVTYDPKACPLCEKGTPMTKRGRTGK